MVLETLNGVSELGGFPVVVMDELRTKFPEKFNESGAMDWEWFEKEVRPNNFVYVRQDKNSIAFTLQNGPVKEVGVNGCQVSALVHAAKVILGGVNKKFPCRENSVAFTKLEEAIHWLDAGTKRQEKHMVEST
jgi:hypothetical protein